MASKGNKVDIKGRYCQSSNVLTVTPACSTHHGCTHAAPTDARSITVTRSSTHAARSHAATHGATYGRTQHPTFARSLQPEILFFIFSRPLAVICVRPHLRAFERTHDSALAATAVIYGRNYALCSTTNNWCVRTQVVRSNALQ
jgi:hypothetical protein